METYYTQIMGHMDVIGIISNGFNIYFPMCMLAFCLATWFSLGSRALNAFGFQQFLQNETIATELVQEGKDLIAREKRRRQRAEEALARRREFGRIDSNTNDYISKYRNLSSGANTTAGQQQQSSNQQLRSPADGLLRAGDNYDYAALSSSTVGGGRLEIPRSLSDEINERFGVSTQVQVGFKNPNNSQFEDDFDDGAASNRVVGSPPRGIFDDV